MRNPKRSLLALLIAASLVAAGCGGDDDDGGSGDSDGAEIGSGETENMPEGEPIIIGMDLDSTGPGASYSVIAGQTIEDAVEQINEDGGILGRPVRLVTENDESDPTRTPSIVRRLLDEHDADVLLLQSAGAAVQQAKSVLQEAGVPAIAPTSISQSIAEPPDNDFIYVLANPISDFVEVYCGAFEAADIETLAIMSDSSSTIAGVNDLLLPGLNDCVDIVAQEEADVDASDVNAQIARIADEDPDAVLVSSVGGNFEVVAQNTLYQQMPDVTRFSLASIGNQPETWDLANPGALEGLIYMASIDPSNPRTQELEEFLEPRRDDDWQMTAYDAQAYDSVYLLRQAIEDAGTADDPVAINEALQAIEGYEAHFGQEGFTISYGPDKHIGSDGLCGLSLVQFDADNRPSEPWDEYQPPC
ncbi:MAG TPA: ABC transporter substrate-binding protein [Acidimicrobiales bacterium]